MIRDREAACAELYERVRTCTLCPLSRTRTLAVPGEGPLTAEVMFIGEAPGANEDRQGRPFVGQAGQFLSELLAAAGLQREDVYICNVLKCRPPHNRDPEPDEIEACRDYLDEQIDLIDPLVIVTLGRFSMAKFFPRQIISRIHGQAKEIAGRYYVPMYHPAAALHRGDLRDVMLDDFRKLRETLERARGEQPALPLAPAMPVSKPEPAAPLSEPEPPLPAAEAPHEPPEQVPEANGHGPGSSTESSALAETPPPPASRTESPTPRSEPSPVAQQRLFD
ncbi:MAG: uracil-DNA glycosylase family protein [Hyphomicrobiales bacterium]